MLEAKTKNIVGKQFKRNKYGLSSWADTIEDFWFTYCYDPHHKVFTILPIIKAKNSGHTFNIKEIVIIDDKAANFMENLHNLKHNL